MKKSILNKVGMQIYLAILFSVIGPLTVMLISKGFEFDLSKLQKAIIAFTFTSASILFLFPKVFKIPFGKQTIVQWLVLVGAYLPKGLFKHILLGVLLGLVSLTGMFLGSYFTGKYEFSWSNISLGHFIFSLTPGIWEEIMFRGVLMIILIRHLRNISKAFWLQTAIFAACHISGFTLEALTEVISVFIIGITFSFVAVRSRALIAGMVYHYIHDAFLFLVQNPKGEYFGFVDSFTFYAFLWSAMLVNIMLIITFTKRKAFQSERHPFSFEGVNNNFIFFEPSPSRVEKSKRIERISLLSFIAAVAPVLPVSIELKHYWNSSLLALILIFSIIAFIFYPKLKKNIGTFVLILNSAGAIISANMLFLQGSPRVYLIYYLVAFLYLFTALFTIITRKENIEQKTL